MFDKYFEQIIPGDKWIDIQKEVHRVAENRALFSIRHNYDPIILNDRYPSRRKLPEDSKLPYVFNKTTAKIKNGLYAEIIARDLDSMGLDINGTNPFDSIPGLKEHLKGLRLSHLGRIAQPIDSKMTASQKIDMASCDIYCPWKNRKINFHTRIIGEDEKRVHGAETYQKSKDPYEKPSFFLDYEDEARRPTELWLMAIDTRQVIENEPCEGDLVFVKHFFLRYSTFIQKEEVEKTAKKMKEMAVHNQPQNWPMPWKVDLLFCTPYRYSTPANIQSREQVKNWLRIRDGIEEKSDKIDDDITTNEKGIQEK